METMRDFILGGSKITVDGDCSHEIKTLAPWKKSYDKPRWHIKKQRHYFANKSLSSQSYGFSSSHVWMWELDYKESWPPKNWCFSTVMLKTLESLLDCKEIKLVHPKGNQSWIFTGRTDAEAETPILWPPDVKNWLIRKNPYDGKNWRQEGKGTTEDEMTGWHHQLDGHEFEKTPGVGDGLGSLACCSPWGCKESDTTEWLNWACFFKPGSNQNDCCPPAKDWEPMWTNLDWSVLCKEGKMPQGRNEGGIWMKCGFLGFAWTCQKQGQFYDYLDFLCESKRNTAGKGNVWPFLWFGNVLVFVS